MGARTWLTPTIEHLGVVDDKEGVLLRSQFAVVIENSAGYISEKLFDAVIAGCIPLFVGPELSQFGIPNDVVLRMPLRADAFPEAVQALTEAEADAILTAGRRWLASDATWERFAMPQALKRLATAVNDNIEGRAQ